MPFYSIGNGCDSCSTVDPMISNINMSMDPGAALVAGLANTGTAYGQQYKQYLTQSGYSAGGSANLTGMGIGTSTMTSCTAPNTMVMNGGGVPVVAVASAPQQPPAVAAQQQAATAVAAAKVAEASANAAVAAANKTNPPVVEGFAPLSSNRRGDTKTTVMWMVLATLVLLVALSVNECLRHFINRALRMEESYPYLFIVYPAVMVLLLIATFTYFRKNM